MNPDQVRQIVREELQNSQNRVGGVPYHIHGGTDSPRIDYKNLLNSPNYFCVATQTAGTPTVNVFGAGGAQFAFTVTGIFVISNDTTAGNITVKNNGNTVATIAKGTVAGAMVGASSLSNTSYTKGTSFTVTSSSAGNADVFVTFSNVS